MVWMEQELLQVTIVVVVEQIAPIIKMIKI